jgi:hypothetical protein
MFGMRVGVSVGSEVTVRTGVSVCAGMDVGSGAVLRQAVKRRADTSNTTIRIIYSQT